MAAKKTHKTSKKSAPKGLVDTMEYYLVDKSPVQLPSGVKHWLVGYGPWVMLAFVLLWSQAVLQVVSFGTVFQPLIHLNNPFSAAGIGLVAGLTLVELIIVACALPGLFRHRNHGWNLLFLSSFIGLAKDVVGTGRIFSPLVIAVLSWYVLFQIRSSYRT